MASILTRTAQQAVLDTVEEVGEENAIDLFKNALPQLEARLAVVESVTSIEGAVLAARQLIPSVRIYGSGTLEELLVGLSNKHYSSEQLSDAIKTASIELEASIKEIRNWVQFAVAEV